MDRIAINMTLAERAALQTWPRIPAACACAMSPLFRVYLTH
jgi:hypothetical protein